MSFILIKMFYALHCCLDINCTLINDFLRGVDKMSIKHINEAQFDAGSIAG